MVVVDPSFQARHAPCARAWAEEGARLAGRNGAPRHRARRLAHAPLLPRATCGRAMHGARARCSFAPALPADDSARPAGRHVRDFRREKSSIRLCPCVDKTTHAQAESHQRLELLPGHLEREVHRRTGDVDGSGHRGRAPPSEGRVAVNHGAPPRQTGVGADNPTTAVGLVPTWTDRTTFPRGTSAMGTS